MIGTNGEPSRAPYTWRSLVLSPPFLIAAGTTILGGLLYAAGFMTMYSEPDAWIVLRRKGPPAAYWVTSYWGKTGHELMPLEGLVLCALLVGFYLVLDLRLGRAAGHI